MTAVTPAPPQEATAPASARIVTVKEPLGLRRRAWPVSAGMPFRQGTVKDAAQLRVVATSGVLPTQARVLSRWPDGSVRWALLDWQVDVAAHQETRFSIETRGGRRPPAHPLKIHDHADGIDVDTGPLRFTVPKHHFGVLTDVRLNGAPMLARSLASFFAVGDAQWKAQPPTTVRIIESGPLRVRIELRGHYASTFDYVARIDAFAGQPFVRVLYTFEQHAAQPYTMVRQIALVLPLSLSPPLEYAAGRQNGRPFSGRVPVKGIRVLQEDNTLLHVGDARATGHLAGWIDVRDARRGVALASRFFWQEYPQSFDLRAGTLTYNLWAPDAAPAKVGMGAAKTHELFLYFHGANPPTSRVLDALTHPLLARLDPRWVVRSRALRNSLAPTQETAGFLRALAAGFQRYRRDAAKERWDDSGRIHCPDAAHAHPRRGFYGMFNWGDWNYPGYHDTTKGCDAWGNLEYDMTQVLALAYAATGGSDYYEGMVAAARHFMDVDRIYYQADHPSWVGMNHPKDPLHFSFELGGVDLGHTWTEGLLSYYELTGDERGLAAARGIADYLVRRLHSGVMSGNPRQWGWPQIALVAAYETTGSVAYRDAALAYARGGMTAYRPDKLARWKMGILAEALGYTYSVVPDPHIRDWLVRYAAAVSAHKGRLDPRFFPALAMVGKLTGNAHDLRLATSVASHLRFGGWGKPFTIAGRIGFSILSQVADTNG